MFLLMVEASPSLPLLRAKHVHGLENIMSALQKSSARFSTIRDDIAEVHANVWQRHGAVVTAAVEKAGSSSVGDSAASEMAAKLLSEPTWGVVGAGRGRDAQPVGLPAPMVCIEWVREADAIYAAELLLKLELVFEVVEGGLEELVCICCLLLSLSIILVSFLQEVSGDFYGSDIVGRGWRRCVLSALFLFRCLWAEVHRVGESVKGG